MASARSAPCYYFNEPMIAMLPHVLCVSNGAVMAGGTRGSEAASTAY